jgi:hypothetical protein
MVSERVMSGEIVTAGFTTSSFRCLGHTAEYDAPRRATADEPESTVWHAT